MKLKSKMGISFLLLIVLNIMLAIGLVYEKQDVDVKSMTYGNYGITVYYKGDGVHQLDMKENRLTLTINNGAKIISEKDTLFYEKDNMRVNLCEAGTKVFAVDEQGSLID